MELPTAVKRHARRVAPVLASSCVVLTLLVCLVLAKTRNVYVGGLSWPFFSDLGRDSPGYEVFCVGLSIVALALAATWSCNHHFQSEALRKPTQLGRLPRSVGRVARVCLVLGLLSTLGLPILAFCSTSSYPSLHSNAAYWFFLLETLAVLLNTYVSYRLMSSANETGATAGAVNVICTEEDSDPGKRLTGMRRTFHLQLGFAVCFSLAFLLYFPIGLAVVAPYKRLTIDQCLERDLGDVYCNDTMKYDDVFTKLWNYENDYSATQMRAAAQLVCILTLVGYSTSFLMHDVSEDRERVPTMEAPTGATTATAHFCAIPMLMSPGREHSQVE